MMLQLRLVSILGLALLAAAILANQQVAWAQQEAEQMPDVSPINRRCPRGCSKIFMPVCASNGQTFANECLLRQAACRGQPLTLASEGACESSTTTTIESSCEVYCTSDYAPVCGSDGVTYPNACNLISANCNGQTVEQVHEGPCE